mgnify:CR=1 FL=1
MSTSITGNKLGNNTGYGVNNWGGRLGAWLATKAQRRERVEKVLRDFPKLRERATRVERLESELQDLRLHRRAAGSQTIQFVGQCRQEQLDVSEHGHGRGLVRAEDVTVDVDLDHHDDQQRPDEREEGQQRPSGPLRGGAAVDRHRSRRRGEIV